ncbi:hybrid sensor histidine kinase/response regulator transcription factor [Reichenbachiella versicolor]|uniref:hybrid sensor histidine kinase/response regulator transcription factor n=1 Tax=Reichenbachiella versicolor TaxID=1821036 RepID=UPI000D6E9CF4|nr:ATP-binding protein [Reichenbachiella versicolor]
MKKIVLALKAIVLSSWNLFLVVSLLLLASQILTAQPVVSSDDQQMVINTQFWFILFLILVIIGLCGMIFRRSVVNREQADKLKAINNAKSRFLANISHDLRSPMTLITGSLHYLLSNDEVFLNSKAERQLKIAQINTERILHMTNEINELAKLEDGKLVLNKKYINVEELLSLFTDMFTDVAKNKGVVLTYTNESFDPPIIHADPYLIEKVLFNLLTNALKHTVNGDKIELILTQVDYQLMISITDTGEGISPDKIPYIFERYYQSPDRSYLAREGFGIGLAVVKEIIEQHGGNVEAYSKLGQGSTFVSFLRIAYNVEEKHIYHIEQLSYSSEKSNLYLDVDDKPVADDIVVNLDKIEVANNEERRTVLIVEDHPEVRDHIKDIVGLRHDVLLAGNGIQALKILRKERVDLLITDLMMPWLDGFELLENLKEDEKLKRIPALVLSARTSDEDKEKVLLRGVNDFLCKPFNPNELLTRIDNLLEKKDLWNNGNPDALFINNQETLDDIEKSLLKKVEQVILKNIDDQHLSVTFLADRISVSERKYYRMIKKLTNTTPFEHIKEIRLQLALKLIKEKNMQNPSEVAKCVGINNVTHFNSSFQKRFGKKPTDYMIA